MHKLSTVQKIDISKIVKALQKLFLFLHLIFQNFYLNKIISWRSR